MNTEQQKHFESLLQQHINALTRQGKSKVTIESFAKAVRHIMTTYDKWRRRDGPAITFTSTGMQK